VTTLGIKGAYVFEPTIYQDERGDFLESYRAGWLSEHVGHALTLVQANCSVSRRGALRGIHFADVPPSQAKYITCVSGAVLDVIVDLRVGSPTFAQWESVRLDTESRRGVYVAEGLGHGFLALEEGSTVMYLCSTGYSSGREHGVNPLDPELGITWPTDVEPLVSPKDAAAPTLAKALQSGLLPDYQECLDYYNQLKD
jgi:dTDP-4-dehydrorhamnose 3,5-epimerase